MFAAHPSLLIIAPLFSFAVTFALTWWLIKTNVLKILDQPNFRSLHTRPIPRIGGIGLMIGITSSWALFLSALPLPVLFSVSLLIAVSLADDIFTLPVWQRLMIHGTTSIWLSVTLLSEAHGWMLVIVIAFAIVWVTNLYNFMDGSDGLAGGMTLIGFGYYGLAAWLAGDETFAMLNFSIAAAAAAFLLFNFHPARIFMGDTGSIPLGFLAAGFGVMGWINALWPLWLPLLVFSPFIADATTTLAKRSVRGEKIWQSHCEHYFQRLVQSGFGHRNMALLGYALMLAAGANAVWAAGQNTMIQLTTGVAWIGAYLMMMFFFDRYWKRRGG